MIRVVRIEPYKNRNKVVLDNEEKFLLYKGDIRKFKLESNQEISKVTYNEIKQLLYERGKERALYILDKTFKTEKQIKDKLIQGMYPEDVIKRNSLRSTTLLMTRDMLQCTLSIRAKPEAEDRYLRI